MPAVPQPLDRLAGVRARWRAVHQQRRRGELQRRRLRTARRHRRLAAVRTPKNPCGDPPNDGMSPPTAEGGALRSQDLRTNTGGGGGGTYSQVVLADSPLAYWRLGEGSGTLADDLVGSQNGTYVNTPTLGVAGASGDGNTAVRLAPPDDEYVNVSSLHAAPSNLSIELWVNSNGNPNSGVGLAGWWDADDNRAQIYWPSTTELRIGIQNGPGTTSPLIVTGLTALANANWHHVVATQDGTSTRLYVDGVLVGGPLARTWTGSTFTDNFRVGQYAGTSGSAANASVDEVAVYNRALTAAEVAEHYAARNGAGAVEPVTLDGSILRVDPVTGAGLPGNPFFASSDPNARRIIATGLRNPFRLTFRPGTNELWFGDVGWNNWEEINRIPNATDGVAENFGWPCYEGSGRQSGYDGTNLTIVRIALRRGGGGGRCALLRLPPLREGRVHRQLPDGQLVDLGSGVLPRGRRVVSGVVPRWCVLLGLQQELHLVHSQGHQRATGSSPAPGLRRRRRGPGGGRDRPRGRPVLRGLRWVHPAHQRDRAAINPRRPSSRPHPQAGRRP